MQERNDTMKDMVPKGTGNSRFLRSSIPENITYEEFVALLRSGKFPVDFAGLNLEGIATQGSAYNKANVLPDLVCTALGIPTSSEPKDAFMALNRRRWKELTRLTTSGTYTVPAGVYELGVFCMGGGMGGGVCQNRGGRDNCVASASSGFIRVGVMKVTPGQKIQYTIGIGGVGASTTSGDKKPPTSGGDTTFGSITAWGGKYRVLKTDLDKQGIGVSIPGANDYVESCGFCCGFQGTWNAYPMYMNKKALCGFNSELYMITDGSQKVASLVLPPDWRLNPFDPFLTFGAAGGHASVSDMGVVSLQEGSAETSLGRSGASKTSDGENATGYGNGGGAGVIPYGSSTARKGGNGSPGIVILYS